ncbi:MAG: acetolactate synthase [Methanomassiliicoccales archaeon PtaU1.Bin124]|nr:MAG: acetolactate synthase [Methanomassiliicoccales archaeon PtaU1.Bin124]
MRASDLVVKCLEAEGLDRIFGIPGEENIAFMDSLVDSDVQFILTRHEQSAAFIAGTLARLTRRPQACLSTLGPGATNLTTGIATSLLSYTPLIALTGQAGADRTNPPQKQVLDIQRLFGPVTKASIGLHTPNRIPIQIRRAFDLAMEERPGPVHLELPEDVMKMPAEGEPHPRCVTEMSRPDSRSMAQIAEMMMESQRPLIIAGNGVMRAGAVRQLRDLCRRWNIPVIHTWFATGMVPYDNPCSLNTTGVRASDNARAAYQMADLIMLIGFDVIEFQPQYWNIGDKKELLYIGESPAGHAEGLEPDVQVIGPLRHVLQSLTDQAHIRPLWSEEIRNSIHQMIETPVQDVDGVKPQNAVRILRKVLSKNDIVVSDVGAHLLWLAKYYPVQVENGLVLDNGLISMGIGIPGAIAAKLAYPDRNVVAVCGDGGFMMTMAELATAKENNVPFVVLIFDDQGYGLIKLKMEKACGRSSSCTFNNPDFVKLAEAFGAEGYRVEDGKHLEKILRDCLRRNVLAVIDLRIDYSENKYLLK